MSDIDEKANDILALLRGEPGPFMETKTSYWGRKRTDPTMKDARMETDCGGAMITVGPLTYGEADQIAQTVDLSGWPAHVRDLTPSCYWTVPEDGRLYVGTLWWAVYSFLTTRGHIPGNPASYNNSMEYLYDEVLKRLVAEGHCTKDEDPRYYRPTTGP